METDYSSDPNKDLFYFDSERVEDLLENGDSGQARDLVNRALELSPNRTDLLIMQGRVYFCMDNFDRALEALERARALGDSNEEIDYFFGEISFFEENFSIAKEHYDTYLKKLEESGEDISEGDLERVSEMAFEFYDNEDPIEALRLYRFVFKNADMWTRGRDYVMAATCLHKFGVNPEEKYKYMELAIQLSEKCKPRIMEQYAGFLFDDGAHESDKQKQDEIAERAITLFEGTGIHKIKNIGNLKRLILLYRAKRDWNNHTRKRIKKCRRRIDVLMGRKKERKPRGRKAKFKTIKKDKRKKF